MDDIEAVRQDMQKKGLLPEDGKIMLYGGSGGGVLIQQYLDKYGEHVSRALIECSGGPDLAEEHNTTFMKKTYLSNESLAKSYFSLMQNGEDTASLAFMLYKIGMSGNTDLQNQIVNSKTMHLFTGKPMGLSQKLAFSFLQFPSRAQDA